MYITCTSHVHHMESNGIIDLFLTITDHLWQMLFHIIIVALIQTCPRTIHVSDQQDALSKVDDALRAMSISEMTEKLRGLPHEYVIAAYDQYKLTGEMDLDKLRQIGIETGTYNDPLVQTTIEAINAMNPSTTLKKRENKYIRVRLTSFILFLIAFPMTIVGIRFSKSDAEWSKALEYSGMGAMAVLFIQYFMCIFDTYSKEDFACTRTGNGGLTVNGHIEKHCEIIGIRPDSSLPTTTTTTTS
eukprot:NODE_99_length_20465_cov_0.827654.p7 type:complete len:244 gc:universal NODE_99_length_20465_cov_0.827654:3667-2936(-)